MTTQKTQLQTEVKAKPAQKAAPKGAQKATSKGKAVAYAVLLASALKGDFGATIQRFYASAVKYHIAKNTAFPRARNAGEPLLSIEDAKAFIEKHAVGSIPAGSKTAQRLFDEMMTQTKAQAAAQAQA